MTHRRWQMHPVMEMISDTAMLSSPSQLGRLWDQGCAKGNYAGYFIFLTFHVSTQAEQETQLIGKIYHTFACVL
jgi:hypothetical protein